MTDAVVAIAVPRHARTNETGRCAVLYPAIAEAVRSAVDDSWLGNVARRRAAVGG
jgi:uncharacterized protein DUF2332